MDRGPRNENEDEVIYVWNTRNRGLESWDQDKMAWFLVFN